MSRSQPDVLVVGAGPVGLTLALQAHDHGARVRVLERRAAAFRPSRALIVHPRTLEVLRPLGVTDALVARGDPSPAIRLHLGRREVSVTLAGFAIPDTAFPYLLFVAQAAVEDVLRRALAARGVDVEAGTELLGVRAHAEGATAVIRRSGATQAVESRYVAGCDGPASTVRTSAGIGWHGGPCRYEVVLADLELGSPLAPTGHAVAGRDGVLFLFPLGERATWRLLATRPVAPDGDRPGRDGGPVSREDLQRLLGDAGCAVPVAVVAWSTRIPIGHRVADTFCSGPLMLAGDAAHVHSPAGGQGMNTGIQDAANLGWKLGFAAASPTAPGGRRLLDTYELERRPVAHQVVALTRSIFWAEAHTDPVARFLRHTVAPLAAPLIPVALARRALVAWGIRVLSQLTVQYRRSPLSVDDGPLANRRWRAGDRLPDQPVRLDGRAQRLHDLLARPGVHLLWERQAPPLDVRPDGGRVHSWRIDDWPGTGVVAVRPDGYIGYQSTTVRPERVAGWLAMSGVVPCADDGPALGLLANSALRRTRPGPRGRPAGPNVDAVPSVTGSSRDALRPAAEQRQDPP